MCIFAGQFSSASKNFWSFAVVVANVGEGFAFFKYNPQNRKQQKYFLLWKERKKQTRKATSLLF